MKFNIGDIVVPRKNEKSGKPYWNFSSGIIVKCREYDKFYDQYRYDVLPTYEGVVKPTCLGCLEKHIKLIEFRNPEDWM